MIQFLGILLMFLSVFSWDGGPTLESTLWFLFGLFLVCSKAIFNHLLYIERQKVRAYYRRRG